MLFKLQPLIENKLSKKLTNGNPFKRILEYMETPSSRSYLYSFISFFMLFYIWIFLFAILYEKPYGYEWSVFPVVFATICFFLGYKKKNVLVLDWKTVVTNNTIVFIALLYCLFMFLNDPRMNIIADKIKDFYVFFTFARLKEFNNNTYVCLNILSYLTIGIVFSYSSCTYLLYRGFYSAEVNHPSIHFFRRYFFVSVLFIVFLFVSYNSDRNSGPFSVGRTTDWFSILVRNFSPIMFMILPIMVIAVVRVSGYLIVEKIGMYFNK